MRKQKLILNKTPAVKNATFKKDVRRGVTINLLPKQVRNESLDGQNYLVVPMVMMTEGVHAGSDGPLYYPADELGKTPVVWNTKPVVVYHPEINGQGASATIPEILQNRSVGMIMNAKYVGNRLKAEAWINTAKADKVDDRILKGIKNNEMMEVSTGLFVDVEETDGTWNKEDYDGIARNYRPDHLALLPDQIGACSIADGAGLLRNAAGKKLDKKSFLRNINKLAKPFHFEITEAKEITENDQSFDDIENALWCALCERYGLDEDNLQPNAVVPWLCQTYSNFVIYSFNNQLYQLDYETTDDGVTLGDGPPTPVERVVQYQPVGTTNATTTLGGYLVDDNGVRHLPTEKDGKLDHNLMGEAWAALHGGFRGNKYEGPSKQAAIDKLTALYKQEGMELPATENKTQTENIMTKKDRIDKIITANKGWAEGDRAKLDACSDSQVEQIHNAVTAPAPAAVKPATENAAAPAAAVAAPVVEPKPAANAAAKPPTNDEWLASAPQDVQRVVRNAMASETAQKTRLSEAILANANNSFTKEQLMAKDVTELQGIARLAAVKVEAPSFEGQGETLQTNAGLPEPLGLPVMNYERKGKKV